jgi:hypothetical protein
VLDVQFAQFTGTTAAIPEFALSWSREARALIAHNIHFGSTKFRGFKSPWELFAPITGDLKSAIHRIAEVWGSYSVTYQAWVVEEPEVFIQRLKERAHGVALKELEGPFEDSGQLVEKPREAGKPYVAWTLNFWFEKDRVYFRAPQPNFYYRLKK